MKICDICKMPFNGWGNNAEPVVADGRCCDDCNMKYVLPTRLGQTVKVPDVMRARTEKLDVQFAAILIQSILSKGFNTKFDIFWTKNVFTVKVNAPQDSPMRRANPDKTDVLEWEFGMPEPLNEEFVRRIVTDVSHNICKYHVPEVA